ncbi:MULTISPECIES: FtsX-like permease family protein [unclassified Microbacterium]|uniref:FtsX-like permease family protein n=1 Tax=unclassified Microbacterium TaxID=2609290 RepID=UPI00300FEC7B
MTLLEAPPQAAPRQGPDAAPPRRRGWSSLRADLRLARRQVRRTKGSSTLVLLLVALPVAGLTGGAVFWQSHVPSPAQSAELELGGNDAWIEAVGGPDPTRSQAVDVPWDHSVETDPETGMPVNEVLPNATDPGAFIPAVSTVREVVPSSSVAVETAGGVGWLETVVGDVWDPVFEGVYIPLEGRAPASADQIMVSPGALERLGARIGDDVVFVDAERTMEITGTMRPASAQASVEVLFLPAAAAAVAGDDPFVRWYVEGWQPDVAELEELNHAGFVAYARDLVMDPPADARRSDWRPGGAELWSIILVGGIGAVLSGYIVVLLAGAAFSVAARRQQRALAMASSVGASRADVFRIVVFQGTVLGVIGGAVGVAVGVAGAAAALALTDRGARGTSWGNFGLQVPWLLIVPIALFAVLVGTLAAVAPARAATKGDALSALRGARRPALLRPRRPLWGILVMATGLAGLVFGAVYVAATVALGEDGDQQSPLFFAALYAVVLGPLVFQIGVLIPSHWILVQISRALSRLGLAPRLASRDAAATPSRVVPAFAVIGACVFAASFVLSMTALTAASNARWHWYMAPEGAVVVHTWQNGTDDSDRLVDAAEELVAPTDPSSVAWAFSTVWPEVDPSTGETVDPDARQFAVARQGYDGCTGDCLQPYDAASGSLWIVAADDLGTILGTSVDAEALEVVRDGGILVTEPDYVDGSGEVVVTEWTPEGYQALMAWNGSEPGSPPSAAAPSAQHRLDAAVVDLGWQQAFELIVTPETAAALGIVTVPGQLVAVYDEPLDQVTVDELTGESRDLRVSASAGLSVSVEDGPDPVEPWLWLIVGVTVVLVLGASAVTLGLARFERRPDDATLTAIGGGRMLRRNVNAWQAAVIVGIGSAVGTATGYLSVWGLATANASAFDVADTPWLWLAVLGIGLPVGITLAAWLVPPRQPDLTRRTAIA